MTLTYTKYFRFPKTDFLSEPWQQGIWDSFDAIDLLMYNQSVSCNIETWQNSTNYAVGNMAIDSSDGSTWMCAVAHVSAPSPTTFLQERQANSALWTPIQLSLKARGQWLNNTQYNVGDQVYDTTGGRNIYAICNAKHTSNVSGTINDDAAYWTFTFNSLATWTASGIGYNPMTSGGLTTNTVQTAIDEISTKYARIQSPAFTGTPTAPTVTPPLDNSTKLATTAFVQSAVAAASPGVSQVVAGAGLAGGGVGLVTVSVAPNGVTNAMLAQVATLTMKGNNTAGNSTPMDLSVPQVVAMLGVAYANNAALTGVPTAPTAPVNTSTTQIATTAFVAGQAANTNPLMDGVVALPGTSLTFARGDHVHPADTTKAPINNPTFTGTPAAPTPGAGNNSTQLATTAFVANAVATGIAAGVVVGDTPPASPAIGQMWWDSVGALLYIWYNDGNSSQWVNANNLAAALGVPSGGTVGQVLTKKSVTDFDSNWASPNSYPPILSINGAMSISQELGFGNWVTAANANKYVCDMFILQVNGTGLSVSGEDLANPGGATGFTNALALGVGTAKVSLAAMDYVFIQHPVEGLRCARLAWGTSAAQPISIGFLIMCDIAGTVTVSVSNSSYNRTYLADVVIPTAGVWQWVSLTIPGDTTGTWSMDTGLGMAVKLCFGTGSTYRGVAGWQAGNFIGTSATMNLAAGAYHVYVTGFIVVPGNVLPAPQNVALVLPTYDQELLACQRYYQRLANILLSGYNTAGGAVYNSWPVSPQMRTAPALTQQGSITSSNMTGLTAGVLTFNSFRWQGTITATGAGYIDTGITVLDARL